MDAQRKRNGSPSAQKGLLEATVCGLAARARAAGQWESPRRDGAAETVGAREGRKNFSKRHHPKCAKAARAQAGRGGFISWFVSSDGKSDDGSFFLRVDSACGVYRTLFGQWRELGGLRGKVLADRCAAEFSDSVARMLGPCLKQSF